ncbi:DUF748 domain-containing protein [Reichenbachiella agarivorans]|uniref:DUF748 domain-containing protein n=1 Tax=Reichenbachiella agarivorans TaxID=2979464 RepID=A0ABY6CJL3_9BACT|nr:DUF748 domain-containing protein [Reichenbachiella agarivorans]UXP30711.1 DUF748 domain-containing protein [Reichenbachiella agarivorans]
MNRKRTKIVFLLYFFLVIPGLFFLVEQNMGFFIDRSLSKQNINVESTGADFDLFSRSVSFDTVRFSNPSFGEIYCTNLKVNKIDLLSVLPSFGFHAQSISVDSLLITVDMTATDSLDMGRDKGKKKPMKFEVDQLDIGYGLVDMYDKEANHLTFNFQAKTLNYNSVEGIDQGVFTIQNLVYDLIQDYSTIKVDSLSLNIEEDNLMISSVQWKSLLTRREFVRKFPFQKDQIDLEIPRIKMSGMNLSQMNLEGGVRCRLVVLDSCTLKTFRDKQLPRPEKPDVKLLADMIKGTAFRFGIDTVKITNTNITHHENYPPSNESGSIPFTNLYATIYDLSSVGEAPIRLDAQATVLAQAKLKARFELNASPKPSHVRGTLSPIDMVRANQMSVPAAGLEILTGQLLHMDFDFKYTDDRSYGVMNMHYEDLQFKIINPDTHDQNIKQGVGTFIANTFKVRTNNTPDMILYREGKIAFERDKKKAVFGYWWQSVLSGIKSSVGVDKKNG